MLSPTIVGCSKNVWSSYVQTKISQIKTLVYWTKKLDQNRHAISDKLLYLCKYSTEYKTLAVDEFT